MPSVEVIVAAVRFISGQKLDTENLPEMALLPPYTRGPSTAVTMAL